MNRRQTLQNGLGLIVERRGSTPVAACWLRIPAGSADETRPQYGAAHFVEHMAFKGTKNLGVGDLARRFDALGGDVNAYTTHDETVFHCAVPSEGLEEALSMLLEMTFRESEDPSTRGFDAAELERERKVVQDEIRGGMDDAGRILGEAVARKAWSLHPYGRPIIGHPQDVDSLDLASLVEFHQRWYRPSQACLTVVGAVDPKSCAMVAERLLKGTEPALPRVPRVLEPPQVDMRLARVMRDFQQQLFEVAFRVPGHGHPDQPALDLLVSALGEGAGALLPSRLKNRDGLVLACWADYEAGSDGGIVRVGFSPAEGQLEDAIRALATILSEVAERGVPADSFQRARTSILADRIYQGETVEGRAATLSWYEGFYGDPEAESTFRGHIMAATQADVAEVARRTLRVERCTVGMLGPETDLSWEEAASLLRPPTAPRSFRPKRRSLARLGSDGLHVHRRVLPSGLTILVEPDPSSETTALRVEGLGGALMETPSTAGHARAWAELLTEGAGDLEATSWARAVESLAGSVRASSGRSTFGLSAEFPAERFHLGMRFALLPLTHPRFDDEAIERTREAMTEDLRTRDDDPSAVAIDEIWALLYPGHPYRLPSMGSPHSLQALSAGRMRALHQRLASTRNLVIAVAGSVDPQDAFEEITRLLGDLPDRPFEIPTHTGSDLRLRSRRLRGDWKESQVHVAFRGCTFQDDDRQALELLATVLGGQGGRMFLTLREEQGLSYGVSATNVEAWEPGAFICSLGTAPESAREALRALRALIAGMVTNPPDAEEIQRARKVLVGATLLDLQRPSLRAVEMAQDERFGLDGGRYRENLLRIQRVEVEDLHRCAAKWLDPARSVEVLSC